MLWGWVEIPSVQLFWKLPCGVVNFTEAVTWHVTSQLPIAIQCRLTEGGLVPTESSGKADVEKELRVHGVYGRGNACER